MQITIRELDELCNSDVTIQDMIEAATFKSLTFDEKNVASSPTNAVKDLYVIIEQYSRNKTSNIRSLSRVIAETIRELEKTQRIYSCYLALRNPVEKKVLKYTYEEPVNEKVTDCFIWLADDLRCGVTKIKEIRKSALNNIIELYYSYFHENELLERNRIFAKIEKEEEHEKTVKKGKK